MNIKSNEVINVMGVMEGRIGKFHSPNKGLSPMICYQGC